MAVENIIGLGFSPDVVQEKGKIIEALNEVYKAAQKIDGLRIEIKMSDSLKEFRKVTNDLQVQYEQLTKTIKDYNKIATEYQKAQEKAAEAEKKAAAAASATAEAQQQSAKSVKEVNSIYGSMIGTIERTLETLNNLKAQLNSNRQAQDNLNKDYQEGKIALQDYQTQLIQLAKEEKLLSQDIKQQNLYLTAQAKELISTEDSYDQLNAKLNQLERTWKSLNKTQREGEVGVNLQKEVAAARAELTKLDETIGNHQRKVGNYAGAWNGLGNSVSQLTRELPSFANSLQTGFMGISNNLPILGDEIKRIRLENAALKAEGKPTTSVLKQLGSAFFSWNTIMSVGITLLVVYGKEIGEFVKGLFGAKTAIDKMKLSQDDLKKALEGTDYKTAIKNVQDLTINIDLAKKGFIDKKDVVKQYNDTMGKSTGKVSNFNEVVKKTNEIGPKYVEVMLYMAAANVALEEAAKKAYETEELRRKKLEDYQNALDRGAFFNIRSQKEYDNAQAQIAKNEQERKDKAVKASQDAKKAQLDIAKDFREKAAKIAKTSSIDLFTDKSQKGTSNYQSKLLEAQKKGNEAQLQQQATLNKSMADLESIGYTARQGFLKKYYDVQQQIIADNAKYNLQKAGLTSEQKQEIQQEAASKSLALTVRYNTENAKLQEKADTDLKAQYKKDQEDVKSFEQKHGKELEVLKFKQRDEDARKELEYGQSRLQDLTTQYNNEQATLTDSLNKKEISETEYAQKILLAQRRYLEESVSLQIAAAEKAAKLTTDPKQFLDLQNKISALKKSYQEFVKETKDNPMPDWQIWAEKAKDKVERVAEALDNLASAMQSIVGISYDNQKTELDELGQKADDNYTKEQENIANSTLSEEEKANKLKVLDAKHDAQKQQIEKRQKQADNERAQFNKQLSIVNIITSTAEAIMKTLAQGGWFALPLTYAIGAMGAAELAAVVATKVPQYAEGTEDHPGGPAIVGEGKHKELVKTPDGKISIADKPMLLDLPKHTQVIPLSREFIDREHAWQWQQIAELTKVQPIDHWEMMAREIRLLKMAYKDGNQGKTHVHNNIKVDLGWYEYIQRNVRGL